MAAIAQTKIKGAGAAVAVTVTTLTASDTLTYVPGAGQVLSLFNTTASPVVITVDGSGGTTINVKGYGTVSVAAGKELTVAANGTLAVELDAISEFLKGTVAVSGGVGINASLTV